MKNDTQILLKRAVPDPFLDNQNRRYLWINSLKLYTVCFYSWSYKMNGNNSKKMPL